MFEHWKKLFTWGQSSHCEVVLESTSGVGVKRNGVGSARAGPVIPEPVLGGLHHTFPRAWCWAPGRPDGGFESHRRRRVRTDAA
jgi:hypothetical protein